MYLLDDMPHPIQCKLNQSVYMIEVEDQRERENVANLVAK